MIDRSRGHIPATPYPDDNGPIWLQTLCDYAGVGFMVIFALAVLAA